MVITFIIFKDHWDKPFFGLQNDGTVNSRTGRGNRSHLTFLGIWTPTHQRGIVHCPTSQPVSKDLKSAHNSRVWSSDGGRKEGPSFQGYACQTGDSVKWCRERGRKDVLGKENRWQNGTKVTHSLLSRLWDEIWMEESWGDSHTSWRWMESLP